jgi:UDP-N-acetylglucosamine:LPS N-acetylglucosamine transferase
MTRVLIISASIGEGHDLPARELAAGLRTEDPGGQSEIVDGLAEIGGLVESSIMGMEYTSEWHDRLYDAQFVLFSRFAPTRAFAMGLLYLLSARRLVRLISSRRPDVVVSTYPGLTDVLGRLRRAGRLRTPVVAAITDLAALRLWAHPGVDLHLITHPESTEEVQMVAPGSEVVAVRGLNSSEFLQPRDKAEARRDLELPAGGRIVVVSGGGWGVGDLEGAIDAVLSLPDTHAVAMAGRRDHVRAALDRRYGADERVHVIGFTDRVSDLFAAADALVHSTAGLTVLEALARGLPVISYGWGRGHIRENNQAYRRFGLAEVAPDRAALGPALERALERGCQPDLSFAQLPTAASRVLAVARPR